MKKRIYKGLGIALAAVLAFGVVACSSEEGHNHSFSADWTKTETTHWHAATCEHTDQKRIRGHIHGATLVTSMIQQVEKILILVPFVAMLRRKIIFILVQQNGQSQRLHIKKYMNAVV